MTRDDIIRIYSHVSDEFCGGTHWCWAGVGEPLQRFADLVAAAERESCAKVCDDWQNNFQIDTRGWWASALCAAAIREIGQG